MKRIAIIPARGGSKRIPQKNIKNFCGKPIISYPIQALMESGLFNQIHVSTDDEKIVEVVNKLNLEVDFYRPKNLSDDHTPIMPVIKFVIDQYESMNQSFDEVWIILPCSPILDSKDLIKASVQFKRDTSSAFLMAVTEYPVPIEWAFEINDSGALQPIKKGAFAIRSQDLKKKYFDAGIFYIHSKESLLKMDYAGSDENIMPYFLPKGTSIDIDDQEDWEYAEKLFKVNER